jgi:hypothetical protein
LGEGNIYSNTETRIGVKLVKTLTLLTIVTLLAQLSAAQDNPFPNLSGPYLGQESPGDTAALFAPGIVADIHHEHSAAIFSPDGQELFWTLVFMPLQSPLPAVIMHSQIVDDRWTKPEVASFSGQYDDDIASISPDGSRLYLSSRRPLPGHTQPNRWGDIWYSDKTADGWSDPIWLDSPINTDKHESAAQVTRKGNLYFKGYLDGVRGNHGIFRSRMVDGRYAQPEPLGPNINTEHVDWCPYIDPEERFILFSSTRPGGLGSGDLYISFMQPDGSFGKALSLGPEINSDDNDRFPALSPNGNYLFFLSKRSPLPGKFGQRQTFADLTSMSLTITNGLSNIYWIDAAFIERLIADEQK